MMGAKRQRCCHVCLRKWANPGNIMETAYHNAIGCALVVPCSHSLYFIFHKALTVVVLTYNST